MDTSIRETPLISIITVTRNDRLGLLRTRLSVTSQNSVSIEHIVVDGDSDDGTSIELASPLFSTATIISEPDDGIYDAMNKGARSARGQYLLFLNSGDLLKDDSTLTRASVALLRDQPEWAVGISEMMSDEGRVLRLHGARRFHRKVFTFGLKTVPHQAAFLRSDIYTILGGYSLKFGIAADQELMYRFLLRSNPRSLGFAVARCDSSGISSTVDPTEFPNRILEFHNGRRHACGARVRAWLGRVILHAHHGRDRK